MTPELSQRLKVLYDSALELPVDARPQFVAEKCDEELRSELAELLKANPQQPDDNTTPIMNLRDLFQVSARPFAAGEIILGRFKITCRLGSGGMGDVYEAMDLELGQVALKTIRADIAGNPELLSRFKREVQLARKVSGPHVCRIHELFVATGPHPAFLTMEFLAGVTLAEKMIGSGPLSWQEARTVALEICSGLQAIHEAGIIHRDLKARNIMLASRNERTCAVLMDFGLASEVARPTDITPVGLTQAGTILGTPDYMAPEQFEGGTMTPATDIYALGVVLYEIVTGKQPFTGPNPAAAAVQRGKRLIPVSSLQPGLPHAWDDIVGKCLEYKPEDRYGSAAEVARELESLTSDKRTLFRFRGSSVHRTSKRSPLRLWLSVLAGGVLVAATAWAIWRFYPRTQPFASLSIDQKTDSGDISQVAISPEGKTLAEVRTSGGENGLWIRNISTGKDVEILAPVQFSYGNLAFSRDGDTVYFARSDGADSFNLYRISVLGGEPGLVALKIEREFSLSPDEKQIGYAKSNEAGSEVHTVTFATGGDSILMKGSGPERSHPTWSPNGRLLAWISQSGESTVRVTVLNLKSKKLQEVSLPADVSLLSSISWLPSGKDLLVLFSKMYNGVRDPGSQVGLLSIDSGAFRSLTNDMTPHGGLAVSGDGKTIATLLQQSGSEIAFLNELPVAEISSTRLPRTANSLSWLDEDRLLTSDPFPATVRRDNGAFRDFQMMFPQSAHGVTMWTLDSISTFPSVCPDGKIIFSGQIGPEYQIYLVDSHGQFEKTLVKTDHPSGNAYCNMNNELEYYSESDSKEPAILSTHQDAPRRVFSLPRLVPVSYASRGKLAAFVLDDSGHSTATLVSLEERKAVGEFRLTDHVHGTPLHFTADGKALGFIEQGKNGFAIALQPLDGSPSRPLTGWFKDPITDFGWSPSGKFLAIMWDRSTSDVALITDKSANPSD